MWGASLLARLLKGNLCPAAQDAEQTHPGCWLKHRREGYGHNAQ